MWNKIGKGLLLASVLAASRISADTLKFAVVPKYQSVFFEQSAKGCQDAAEQIPGVECIYRGPEKGNVREQNKIIEQLISEGVDGIAVAVTKSDFLAKHSIQKAVKAGIPIITYDSDFDTPTLHKYKNLRLAYIGTNNFKFGRALGEQLKKLRPQGGTLMIQTGRPDAPNLNLRIMGLRSALSGKTYANPPGDMLKNEQGWSEVRLPMLNYDNVKRAIKQLDSFLKVKPNKADAFVAVGGWPQNNEQRYREIITPFQGQLNSKETVIIMSDASAPQLGMLRDRLAHANIGQNPYEMGKQAIFTLFKVVSKLPYEKVINTPLSYCTVSNYNSCSEQLM